MHESYWFEELQDDKSLWNDHVPYTPEETRFSEQSNH